MNRDGRRACANRSAIRLIATLILTLLPVVVGLIKPDLLASPLIVPALILQVIGLTGVSNGAHESVHGHLFTSARVDRFWGRVLHGLLLLNHDVHRRYHLMHHAYLGTERDPEGAFDFNDLPSRASYTAQVLRWSVPPSPLHILNWKGGVDGLLGRAGPLGRPIRRQSVIAGLLMPVLVVSGLVTWTMFDPRSALLAGYLPLLVFFPVYTYLTALPEHFGLATRVEGMPSTRNVTTAPALQYLIWNFNLHAVHHAHPNLHFSLLPGGVDEIDAPTADGYLRFHFDVLRQIGDSEPAPESLGVRA